MKRYIDFLLVSHDKGKVLEALSAIRRLYRAIDVVADPVFRRDLERTSIQFEVENKKKAPSYVRVLINIADNAANWFRVAGTVWLVKAI